MGVYRVEVVVDLVTQRGETVYSVIDDTGVDVGARVAGPEGLAGSYDTDVARPAGLRLVYPAELEGLAFGMPGRIYSLGRGVLQWDRSERVSDRYGFVQLNPTENTDDRVPLTAAGLVGRYGRLRAVVLECRRSDHIGDLYHGVFPDTPAIGEVIVLGAGRLRYEEAGQRVGLEPLGGRPEQWLDLWALYRCHVQTVELWFDERAEP